MKRKLLFMLCLLAGMLAMAGPVTQDEARQRALSFLSERNAPALARGNHAMRLVAVSHYEARQGALAPCYYVFNVGTAGGFVVMGGDDRMPDVLGYSDAGSFDPQTVPANLKAWLQTYNDQMGYLNDHPEAAARKTVSGGSIGPLLGNTEWNQSAPYNDLCPVYEGEHCYTGCVATAMAQVMYYHKWPAQTTAEIPGFTTGSLGLSVDAIPANSPISWADMVPQYTGGETSAQNGAVAQLMLMCGTSVSMDYTTWGSGAWGGNVAIALKAYFDYDGATSYEARSDYRLAQWNQKVYDELSAGRPVYYDGQSSGGGHAFVIDGYDSNDYFHVNWGWGGYCNGYFLLSILDPGSSSGIGASSSSDGYSFGQGAVFGAQKNTGAAVEVTPILTTESMSLPSGNTFTRTSSDENFTVEVKSDFGNNMSQTYTFDFGVGLFDTSDNLVSVSALGMGELAPGYGYWYGYGLTLHPQFGAEVTSGNYMLKIVSRESGTDTWHANKGSDQHFISVAISDNTVTLQEPVIDLSGTITTTGKTEVGSHVPMDVTITNNGTLFNGEIFLVVDGQMQVGRHFDIDAGDTQTVGFSFVPSSAGTKSVSVCLAQWNGSEYVYTPFASANITIGAAAEMNLSGTYDVTNATDYVVSENVIKLQVTLTNNSASDYDDEILAQLYMDGHDGFYYYLKEQSHDFQLASGKTGSLDFEFTNLENENYLMIVCYKSAGEWQRAFQTYSYEVNVKGSDPEPVEETAYYLVSDLNGWSTTDKSYPFTKLDDGKTWEITFPGNNAGNTSIYLKVAPGSAYDNQASFWRLLLCAPEDGWTALSGNMVINGGAWLMDSRNNAESYTMRIVPSEMTYEITVKENPAPFVPEPPFYFIGTNTNWAYDPAMVFEPGTVDGTYTITVPAVYQYGMFGCKIAPAGAIGSDGSLDWNHIFGTEWDESQTLNGNLLLGNSDNITRPESDGAESYTITINPTALTYNIVINEPIIEKFTVTDLVATGSMLTGEEVSISVTVKNDGNVESGQLYVFVDGELLKTLELNIAAGQSQTYTAVFTPTTPGDKVVSVAEDEEGTEVAASETITIEDPEIVLFNVTELEVEGSMTEQEAHVIKLTVQNDGNVATGAVYVFVNNNPLQRVDLDITPGESRDYELTFTPQTIGDYDIMVTADEEATDVLAETTVTIITPNGIDAVLRSLGDGPVLVYSTSGRLLANTQAQELKRVMRQLPKGVYIVRSGRVSKAVRN